ncbi:MAG TPA: DUF5990 family protein [Pyrinomonadaceae bacterium]|nr:DUF5990 family protein [Pyrinomonadaceae bacterium]
MEAEITLRIVLLKPPAGCDFGVQKGSGNTYETIQTQRSKSGDLTFEFPVRVKEGKNGAPNFLGPFAQGPADGRFVYLDIGTYAGQAGTQWSRRLKIPLRDISWQTVAAALKSSKPLETRVQGTGRDGGPSCGTIKPFAGWKLA